MVVEATEATDTPTGDNRPSVYHEGDRLIFRASAFGNCDGELVRHGMGFTAAPPPDWLQARFDEGNRWEDEIIDQVLIEYGAKMLDGLTLASYGVVTGNGQVEAEYSIGKSVIRVHPDGVVQVYKAPVDAEYTVKERFGLEVKLLGPDAWRQYKKGGISALPWGYDWQASIEMLALDLPLIYGVAHKDAKGEPVRNKAGDIEVDTQIFRSPPIETAVIRRRLLQLTSMVRNERIPVCSKTQYPCGFYEFPDAACNREDSGMGVNIKQRGPEVDIPGDVMVEIREVTEQYDEAALLEKKWKKAKSEAQEKLRGYLDKYKVEAVERVYKHKARKPGSYDKERAKSDGFDFEEYWVPGEEYYQIRVKKEKV